MRSKFDEPQAEVTGALSPVTRLGETGARWRSHPVARFVLRRLLAGVGTGVVASVLVFFATNALPGNVATAVLGKDATPERIATLTERLGLDESVFVRYGHWMVDLMQGSLGDSATKIAQGATSASVTADIATPFRNSLILALIVILLLLVTSLVIGVVTGLRAGSRLDVGISYSSLVIGALPEFVFGTILIVVFYSWLGWFSPVALVPPGESPISHLSDLVLPVFTLLGVLTAFAARQVRRGVVTVLEEDYIRMARLSGIAERRVLSRYIMRNALAPSVQAWAQSVTYLFGGIIVAEALFAYPGIGQALVSAVSLRDIPVVTGISFVLAMLYITVNIAADLIVVLIVPKLRTALT